jgi:hypothetical protein
MAWSPASCAVASAASRHDHGWAKKDRIAGATILGLLPQLAGPGSLEPL